MTRSAWRPACAAVILAAALLNPAAARGPAGSPLAGPTTVGRNGYVEFRAGDLPIVISVPHGGSLEPADIPNRTAAMTATDLATEELARLVAAALQSRTGREPSLVVCKLKRTKIDVNRDIGEGAQGNATAEQAWNEYHAFLAAARAAAAARHGRALVVDLHGHSHLKGRVELGYLIGAADLARPDAEFDDPALARQSSIRTLAAMSGRRFSVVVRGPASLGGLLERAGYPSVPAPAVPKPGVDPYFDGGYITRRHGSADGGPVSAIQVETPFAGFRDTPAARERFAGALADALLAYVSTHLRIER